MITGQPCDRGVIAGARDTSGCAREVRPWVLAATILGSSMAFIDGTVVNVALPALQRGLGATVTDVQWVVEGYALLLSALLLIGGSLGDHFGRRRVFAIGVAVFAVASGLCGISGDVRMLVAARAAQGIGAALLVPGSLAIISASIPERERGPAIGVWSGFSAMTAAVGPVLGGWLIQHLSWRWAFFINLPIAAAVLVLLFWRVPESRDSEAADLDLAGAALATLGLGGIVFALIESSHMGWRSPLVLAALALGAAGLLAFALVEWRSAAPMLPRALFRSRAFTGSNLLTLCLYGAMGGTLFFVPLDLIQVQGYSPTAAGASFLPFIMLMFVLSRWSGGLVDRFGARLPLIVGPVVAAMGFALLGRPGIGGGYWSTFFPPMVVLGLGMAMTVAPLTTTVMNSAETHRAGVAAGINNAVSRVAGLLAIALMSVMVVAVFDRALDHRLAAAHVRPPIVTALEAERLRLGAAEAPAAATPAERALIHRAIAESFVAGFRATAWVATGLAVTGAVIVVLLVPRRRK